MHRIAVLRGDGIGKEGVPEAVSVLYISVSAFRHQVLVQLLSLGAVKRTNAADT
jgi:isocitrate/isopropylmalate dehydrogenase